ncbi:hypothetical protein SO694_0008006 [Aureococcus anophagefferens]|uniref:Uncharacterized protein n=1 Tax=Aureococcus anophagefferens TaxID=44056 RepID=A0ABR1G5B9_AURAN
MSEGPGNASRIARWEEKKARAAARRAEQQRQDSQQARQTGLQQVPGMAVPHRVDMFTKASGMVEAPRHDDPFARPALAPEPAEPSQPPRRRPSSKVSQPPGGGSSWSIGGGVAAPRQNNADDYQAQLRAQVEARECQRAEDRRRRVEADRADDARVARGRAAPPAGRRRGRAAAVPARSVQASEAARAST